MPWKHEYAVIILEKKTGHKWIYGMSYGHPDFLALSSYTDIRDVLTYPTEELAIKTARRVVPKEAYKKHWVHVAESTPEGWYCTVELS